MCCHWEPSLNKSKQCNNFQATTSARMQGLHILFSCYDSNFYWHSRKTCLWTIWRPFTILHMMRERYNVLPWRTKSQQIKTVQLISRSHKCTNAGTSHTATFLCLRFNDKRYVQQTPSNPLPGFCWQNQNKSNTAIKNTNNIKQCETKQH